MRKPDDNRPLFHNFDRLSENARALGIPVIPLPHNFSSLENEDLLSLLGSPSKIFYNGPLLGLDEYGRLDDLYSPTHPFLNPTGQMHAVMSMDYYYPLISHLTARTYIINIESDIEIALGILGSPVFVKGMIKSHKELGYAACVTSEIATIRSWLNSNSSLALREVLPLRNIPEPDPLLMPITREYRLYVLGGRIAGLGYYWGGKDPFGVLTSQEVNDMCSLALQTYEIMRTNLIAVDVAQLEDSSWKVIEIGDPQFSGIAHINQEDFLTNLADLAKYEEINFSN